MLLKFNWDVPSISECVARARVRADIEFKWTLMINNFF